ncbi:hypothetical protein RZS28_03975 [Methylocapsa polymorpha]|uniref:Uncharacterized protein n=1 Tax=Methylocapsa polymorpha TaxID=3080828 RepID=A0ABZ0HTC7_9HYPH|nr:hypothetical protein RZS28_03975 [Methylocapsa sp. RX1]
MTTWTHRIIRYSDGRGFSLHEVFYDEADNPVDMTAEPISFTVETAEGPSALIEMLKQALLDAERGAVLDESTVRAAAARSTSDE